MDNPNNSPANSRRSPWLWVPSLYFSQGIPYVVVMTMSVIMFKRLGISNTDVAFYTSLLYLPWVVKPLWSPLVDICKTKRLWIVGMQFLIAAALVGAAAAIPTSAFFKVSLGIFWVMAFASATHDIAADGFYMLGVPSKHEQAWWVGIRSTFYRLAMIVGSGVLIVLAGVLESKNGLDPMDIPLKAEPSALIAPVTDPQTITVTSQSGPLRLLTHADSQTTIPVAQRTAEEAKVIIDQAKAWNKAHGFFQEIVVATDEDKKPGWFSKNIWSHVSKAWTRFIGQPLENFLKNNFAKTVGEKPSVAGNVGVIYFTLSQAPAAGQNVVVNFERKKSGREYLGFNAGDRGFRLVEGERFVFNEKNWNVPFMAIIQLDPKLQTASDVVFSTRAGNIPLAWSITLFALGGIFLVFSIYHQFALPRPATDVPHASGGSLFSAFFGTFGSYFSKPGIVPALGFILLYRFPEAQALKLVSPFLLDAREAGGLGLSTSQVGLAYGTIGILALTFGGILGGMYAAKKGLKKALPLLVCAIHLPNLAFLYLSFVQPDNFVVISGCIAVEQFGYGFGFAAYMLYLLYFSDGEHKTAHYAICTGFMALGMMLPGMWSGWLQDIIGYKHFFVWVIISTIPSFLVAFLVKVDPNFGRKTEE